MIVHEKNTTHTLESYDLIGFGLFDEVWYIYEHMGYEGAGVMIVREGNLYDFHDMSHCSCYGPTDRFYFSGKSLDELKKQLMHNHEFFHNEIKQLFDLYPELN